jgi:hypothetical protein
MKWGHRNKMNKSGRQKEAILNVFAAAARALMRLGLDHAFVLMRSQIAGRAQEIVRARSATSTNSAAERSGFLALAMQEGKQR